MRIQVHSKEPTERLFLGESEIQGVHSWGRVSPWFRPSPLKAGESKTTTGIIMKD